MVTPTTQLPNAVVVHAGARDRYQVALALAEAGKLSQLVTSVFSAEFAWRRFGVRLDAAKVTVPVASAAAYLLMRLCPALDLHIRSDAWLGVKARHVAWKRHSALLAYSYYAYEAFSPGPHRPLHRILFQVHPHPTTVKATLAEECERVPAARGSLLKEHELRIDSSKLDELSAEASLATGWITASRHTASTLARAGVNPAAIHIVPYGVSPSEYPMRIEPPRSDKFVVMFLGSIIQRKGLSYLLDAVRMLSTRNICVRLRGRGYVDQKLLAQYADLNLDISLNRSTPDIVRDLHTSHLMVLPSLEEGFGHAILESMSCGVPVITTDRSAGPELIETGVRGFVVPIRSAEAIASRIEWGIRNPDDLAEMGRCAAHRAQEFTWARFREGINRTYLQMTKAPVAH